MASAHVCDSDIVSLLNVDVLPFDDAFDDALLPADIQGVLLIPEGGVSVHHLDLCRSHVGCAAVNRAQNGVLRSTEQVVPRLQALADKCLGL